MRWLLLYLLLVGTVGEAIAQDLPQNSTPIPVQTESLDGTASDHSNSGQPLELTYTLQQSVGAAAVADRQSDADQDAKLVTQEKRDHVAEQIRVAERKVQEQQSKDTPVANDAAKSPVPTVSSDEEVRLRLLKQIDVMLAQLEQQARTAEDNQKEIVERTQELQDVKQGDFGFEKPYSFLLLDLLQDERASVQSKLSSAELNQKVANEDIVQAKQLLEQKEQAYRLAKEAGQIVTVPGVEDSSRFALEVRYARETLAYRKKLLELLKLNADVYTIQVEIVQRKIDAIRDEAAFSPEDLAAKQAELTKREEEIRRKLKQTERPMEDSDTKWLNDRKLLTAEVKPTPQQTEEIELRRFDRLVLQTIVSSMNFRLELLNQSRQAWDYRYQFANSLSISDQEIERELATEKNVQQRERDFSNRMLQQEELRKTIATLESKIASLPNDTIGCELRRIVELQKNSVRLRTIIVDEDIAAIQANRRILAKLLNDFKGDAGRYSLAKITKATWYHTKNIWNAEVMAVEERPITPGKIILALVIFLGGFWLSRFLSRRLRGFLTKRIKVDESAAAAFQSLAFYGMAIAFLLGALNFVSIPLTVFTFLGGALAIGVGFGSKNVLSNFISGLILLAERPIKVGDLIQMDEFSGNVENIGTRSTIVRTANNMRLIVPNSRFLESNVINFSHGGNTVIRTKVCVGVSYGSPTKEVEQLLLQAADDHGLVLADPEPFVLFREFADNSLNFEIRFWINASRPLDQLKMESDIRYRVESLFNSAGIVIAYPQRDVHLKATGPLDFRLVAKDEHQEKEAAKAA